MYFGILKKNVGALSKYSKVGAQFFLGSTGNLSLRTPMLNMPLYIIVNYYTFLL